MDIVKQGNITELDASVRIEPLPRKIKATATPEVLDNSQTAVHYQAPRLATPEELASPGVLTDDTHRFFLDAEGKPIEPGKPFNYLDWLGHVDPDNTHATVWGVYRYEPRTASELKARGLDDAKLSALNAEDREAATHVWREVAQLDTYDEALAAGVQLLNEGSVQ